MSGKGIVVSVELKNGVVIQGKLDHVDKYMNFNLFDINVDTEKYPQLVSVFDLRRLSRTVSSEDRQSGTFTCLPTKSTLN